MIPSGITYKKLNFLYNNDSNEDFSFSDRHEGGSELSSQSSNTSRFEQTKIAKK